ncbi:MAG: FtsK/SpoIIIE domain-containing protein [Bacteroidota bacterium]
MREERKELELQDAEDEEQMVLPFDIGRVIESGREKLMDILELVHTLIRGCTGMGKIMLLNRMLIEYLEAPVDVQLILIDPQQVELAKFKHHPDVVYGEYEDAL